MKPGPLALSALLLGACVQAQACGVCAEDKVAATYDHASVQQALAHGRVVVYCELDGVRDLRRVRAAAARLRGVQPATVRVSAQPPALSFVLDPRQQSPEAAVASLQGAVAAGPKPVLLKVER